MQLLELQSLMDMNIRTGDVLLNLLVAFLCGLVIAQTYKLTFGGASYSKSISNSLVVLAMITTVVIIVIGNNLARAFGLVGAMSIIRFRTAVKDPMDIVFIFFSLAIGLAAGVGLAQIAIVGPFVWGAVDGRHSEALAMLHLFRRTTLPCRQASKAVRALIVWKIRKPGAS